MHLSHNGVDYTALLRPAADSDNLRLNAEDRYPYVFEVIAAGANAPGWRGWVCISGHVEDQLRALGALDLRAIKSFYEQQMAVRLPNILQVQLPDWYLRTFLLSEDTANEIAARARG